MAIVGNLFVNLKANTAAFGRGMDKARSKSKSSMSSITGNLKKIGLAAGLMGAAAVAGFALLIKKSADAADKLGKLSEATGISVENLSALGHAAELSGIDMDFVAQRMVNLARRAKEADRGVKSYALAFEKLGITLRDNDGNLKATDALLLEVADGFARMEDGTLKAAIATDIFSNAGVALIPLLNKGSAGIRAMMDEAKELGLVISTETAIAAQEFNDNLSRLSGVVRGLSTQLFAELAPALESGTASLVRFAKESSAAESIVKSIGFAFRTFFSTVALGTAILDTLGITIKRLGADFILSFEGDIEGLRANTEFFAREITDVWTTSLQSMMEAMGLASETINKAQKKITDGNVQMFESMDKAAIKADFLGRAIRQTGDAHQFFSEKLARALALQKEELEALAKAPQLFADSAAEARALVDALGGLPTAINGLGSSLEAIPPKLELMRDLGKQFSFTLTSGFVDLIARGDKFSDVLQRLASSLAAMLAQLFVLQLFKGIFGGLFGFAGGGKVTAAAPISSAAGPVGFQAGGRTPTNVPILVGERGRELFVPDTAGRIVPNESIGGLVINIDARGADASVELRVRRAISEAMKQSVELSRLNILDRAQRGG